MKISKILILSAAALSLAACGGHTHTFASEWTYDETNHWHAATCEHIEEKSGVAAHTLGADGKCTVCDYTIPKDNKVTKEEWEAAFGLSKPYYIADNYKMDFEMNAGGQTMASTIWVDGLKLKTVQTQGVADETYNEIVDGQKYQYQFDEETSKWTKIETTRTIADYFANYLEPFGANYTSFAYDNIAKTYKCPSLSFGGHSFTNLSIKFENKRILEIVLSSVMEDDAHTPFTMTFAFAYGGQTVTLPTVDPEPAQGMTEDEFNALVNKAYTKGFYFKTSAPQADCISSTVIFDCVNKNLYISENWKDEDFIGITVYFDSVVYFKSPMTGEWQEPRQLSSEELETQFNAGLAEYLMQILPTTDFSDFTFNPDDGTYEVTMNLSPYEGVEITMVYVYVMDANGITSISGTTTYVYGGESQTSTVSIYDVDIGEQEITPPEVEKKEVNYIINNSMTWENAFGLKKGYYFFNTNYKATMKITTAASEENYVFTADLLNLKYELTTNNYGVEKYYSIEDNKYYEYSLDTVSSLWNKQRFDAGNLPVKILRDLIINPFKTNYSSFNYDETIKSYKCQTLTYNNQEFNNVILHFEDSSLISASFDSFYDDAGKTPFSATFSIVYGGQTVTLPQVD